MKAALILPAACLITACGCSMTDRLQEGQGASHLGAPAPAVDASVLAGIAPRPAPADVQLPGRITLPATYRLVLLDGHLSLVRETDPEAFERPPATMRIVTGEIARGELAYQPGLLPQELAAEVAANRESSARMDNSLELVMRRSRELSEQALELQAQARKLAEMLSAAEARVRQLEAARPDPGRAPGPRTDAAAPSD